MLEWDGTWLMNASMSNGVISTAHAQECCMNVVMMVKLWNKDQLKICMEAIQERIEVELILARVQVAESEF